MNLAWLWRAREKGPCIVELEKKLARYEVLSSSGRSKYFIGVFVVSSFVGVGVGVW